MRTKSFLLAALLMTGVTATTFAQETKEKPCDNKRQEGARREAPAPRAMGIDCTMATTMKLTIEQVYAIGQSQIDAKEAMKALREDKEMTREEMREKSMELMKAQKETIKETLTPEQYIIYLEQQIEREHKKGGEGKPMMVKKGGDKEPKGDKCEKPSKGKKDKKDAPKADKADKK